MSNVILKKENSTVKTKNEAILLYCIMKKKHVVNSDVVKNKHTIKTKYHR